jgi:fructokinase
MVRAKIYGGIEAGGTKFVCAAGTGPDNIVTKMVIPTTLPKETLNKVIWFFRQVKVPLGGVGVASFGPLDLDKRSETYGSITTTPKPGWANADLVNTLADALKVPVFLDTDVNGAALGEGKWGAAQKLDTFIYLTIGTGIGGGAVINGKSAHGLVHPEMGHILLPHDLHNDDFSGCCPYHQDCFEGLASGTAVGKRWGKPAEKLPPDHPAWALEAEYIAAGVMNLIVTLSPQRVILGGGIMKVPGLIEKVRARVKDLLNGYVSSPVITEKIDEYIVPPGLGDMAGVLGAIAMAQTGRSVKGGKQNEDRGAL